MNATTEAMKARLPRREILCPGDIAMAMGHASSIAIIQAIKDGRIAAAKSVTNGRFAISHHEAERFIDSTAYIPDEGTI